jgi:hypothetical protein
MEMKKRNTSKTIFSNPMDYNWPGAETLAFLRFNKVLQGEFYD